MKKISIRPEFVSDLYGKKIIAFGTGKVGKVAIPYIGRDPQINLLGASNSRITRETMEEYLDVKIAVRPLSEWYALYPDATIYITILDKELKTEAQKLCLDVGFTDIMFIPYQFFSAISYAFINDSDQYLSSSYHLCKSVIATTRCNPMLEAACLANEIRDLHTATFSEFANCNRNKDVVVVGCGPTLNYYQPIQGAKHVGVNAAYKKSNLKLDYLFVSDYTDISKTIFENIENLEFHKFFADRTNSVILQEMHIPVDVLERCNGKRYYVMEEDDNVIHWDILHYPLMFFDSTIFSAIHFALFTRPRRLFLVGCDCTVIDHFDGEKGPIEMLQRLKSSWMEGYEELKQFVKIYCPSMEIVSINPIGLRGMFRDVYSEDFLKFHPEIERTCIEVI